MHFIDRLYTGEKAEKNRGEILRDLQEKRYRSGIYVITPPANGNNILDIYPAKNLEAPYYEKKDLLVIGIAKGREEALVLAGGRLLSSGIFKVLERTEDCR